MALQDKIEDEGISIAERLEKIRKGANENREAIIKEVQDRTKETDQLKLDTDALKKQMAAEITARTAADNQHEKDIASNTAKIEDEIKQRQARNTEHDNEIIQLGQDLNKESAAREREDKALDAKITETNTALASETKARQDADNALTDRIAKDEAALNTEVQNRTNDVKTLNTRVDNTNDALNKEIQDRIEGDNDEKLRAEGTYPKMGGAGAYGIWNISINGNAATATEAEHAARASEADHAAKATNDAVGRDIASTYEPLGTQEAGLNTNWNTLTDLTTYKINNATMTKDKNAPEGEYASGVLMVEGICSSFDNDGRIAQIYYPHKPNEQQYPVWVRTRDKNVWSEWIQIASAKYVRDYAPSKTGSGATGDWEIKARNAYHADEATHAASATTVNATAANGGTADLVSGAMAGSDYARIRVRGANDNGELEIATADNGNESIYVAQYTGTFQTIAHQITLMDASGDTTLNNLTANTIRANTVNAALNGDVNGTALKATNDGQGRNIVETYATKADVEKAITDLQNKVNELIEKSKVFDSQGRLVFPNGNKFWVD